MFRAVVKFVFWCVCFLLLAESCFAQFAIDGDQTKRLDTRFIHSIFKLLPENNGINEELELLDYQADQLRELQKEFQRELRTASVEIRKLRGEERKKRLDEVAASTTAKLREILLPHQFKRVRQITFQSMANPRSSSSMAGILLNSVIRNQLQIDKKTYEKIVEQSKTEKERLDKEIAQLKKESEKRLLENLSAEQRKKLNELIGEVFDFSDYATDKKGRLRHKDKDH